MEITLTVNGEPIAITCEPSESLRAVLRRAGFFSVRFGAETGETGEIWFRAPSLIRGYWNRPDATAETIHRPGGTRSNR